MNERKVYLITGGSEGIGLAIAKQASTTANVLIVARDRKKLEHAIKELSPGNHAYISADLSQPGEAKRVVDETIAKYGRLDGLVNNAGTIFEKPFIDCTLDDLRRVFALNFLATVETCHTAVPYMLRNGAGVIVNMSSMAGIKTYPNESAYGTSKAAVNKFTEQLWLEYKNSPVRVFALAPGSIDTPGLRGLLEPQRASLEREVFKTFTLDEYYQKILTPDQIGRKVVELLEKPKETLEPIVVMKSYEF